MINLSLGISIPWWNRFENIWATSGHTPFKNKFWEAQVMKSDDVVSIDLRVTTRTDHAGVDLWLGLLGYSVNLKFYDNRHWDHKLGVWQNESI
jgi:hypothetical protein